MAKRELTAEERERLKENLAKGRATAAANRAAKVAEPDPADEDAPVDGDEPIPLELSAAELARIREEAKKKVDAELADVHAAERKKLMAKALDAEILAQRRAAGLIDYRDDKLNILIDVAPFASDITIDATVYQHGHWYEVDRRRYDSLREIMARSWDSEDRAGNPNRRFRREVAGTMNPLANELRDESGNFTIGFDPGANRRASNVRV
jgi:hypothetical protein